MSQLLEQTAKLAGSIPPRRRAAMAAIVLAAGVGMWQFVEWQRERGFKTLYTGLGAEDAGQVVQKLKESGVEYRLVEGGSAVLVPDARVAELRLEMANSGLPRSGRIGFELFDKTTFGATDFAEHVNYRRAVEGELERSVMSIAEVEQARVHVTFPKDSIYTDSRQAAKASVLVKMRAGALLPQQSVLAITHLLSSAVEGLSPDQVSVLDMRGRLLSKAKKPGVAASQDVTDATLEHQQKIEKDILQKIQSTLGPLLGEDKFRAAVSAECEINSGEQNEETYDPTKSVMTSSQSTVDTVAANPSGGQPGTAPNLPAPPAAGARGTNSTMRKTENATFQTSRLMRRLTLQQGALKSVSISVLLDQAVKWEKTESGGLQKVYVPPSADTVKVIRDLVSGVAGLKKERGDQLIVESLPFESTVNAEPPAAPAPPAPAPKSFIAIGGMPIETAAKDPKIMAITGGVALAVVGLFTVLLLFVRKRRAKAKAKAKATMAPALAAGEANAPDGTAALQAGAPAKTGSAAALEGAKQSLIPAPPEDILTSIRQDVKANPAVFAGVVQDWLIETGAK